MRGKYVSLLEELGAAAERGVEVRLLHAGVPSRAFRRSLASARSARVAIRQCPRVHLKVVCVDASELYLGSANFTGAGLGAKSDRRRNFELGIVTDDDVFLDAVQARYEAIWSGRECASCQLRRECPKPLDTLASPNIAGRKAPA